MMPANSSTSINDISDLVRIIKEQPEWADTLRAVLLGQELLELPARFAEFVELTNERFDRLEGRFDPFESRVDDRFDRVDDRFNQVDSRFDRIEGKLDNLVGMLYELRIEKKIGSIAGQYLQLRRVKVPQWGRTDPDSAAFMELIYQAEDDGIITGEQFNDLGRTDLIFTGQTRAGRADAQVTAEVSVTIGDSDITQAVRRAGILESVTGRPVMPAVIGAHIDDARTELANANGVSVVLEPEGQ